MPSSRALLILDMISEFDFPDWKPVLKSARRIAPRIARLRERARNAGVPVVYVNDIPADWDVDRRTLIRRCTRAGARGREVVSTVAPGEGDYFIYKPKHSGFFASSLDELLATLGRRELILTGTTTHQCVLFTAMDAYVRDYSVVIPRDCVAAATSEQSRHGLFILQHALRARVIDSTSLRFSLRRKRSG
jgi:nicotinamidase-related amidase